jgi:hypothetical protein
MSVYKIWTPSSNFVYIGQTVKPLNVRLSEHEIHYGGWLTRGCRKYYITSFEILKYGDYRMELLETVDDPSILNSREIFHINNSLSVNIIHNKNVSLSTFLCPCGKTVDSSNRYGHSRSTIHRRDIRELHFNSDSRIYFINLYKQSRINKLPIPNGITLCIDC